MADDFGKQKHGIIDLEKDILCMEDEECLCGQPSSPNRHILLKYQNKYIDHIDIMRQHPTECLYIDDHLLISVSGFQNKTIDINVPENISLKIQKIIFNLR
jgi:hypothetical protein